MENEFKKANTDNIKSRLTRHKLEEEQAELKRKQEIELEAKRQELKSIIFDDKPKSKLSKDNDNNPNIAKQNVYEKKPKKIIGTHIFLALTIIIALAFLAFVIYDSFNRVNQIYQIINASLICLITIGLVITFRRAYNKHKKMGVIFTALLLIVLMVFNVLHLLGLIKLPKQSAIPDFNDTTITEAIKWAEANNIKYDQVFEYSDNIEKYKIISQNPKAETLTKNIDNASFAVSNGPDYNKEVIISDMTGWDIDEVVKVIDENFLNNVTVNYEENKETKKDIVTSQNKSGNITRNEAITFTVSLGDKANLTPISLKNLKNMTVFKATLYLKRHGIDFELKYEFSDTVAKGNVISSEPKEKTTVKPDDKITLTISKGKEIIVPELKNMKMSEVTKWIINNNLKIKYSDKYDNDIKSGRVIEATYKKGDIIEEETTVGIVVSKGKLKLPTFNDLAAFKAWANKYEIKYEIKEEFNDDLKKDEIIKFSVNPGKTIDPKETIIVYVSKGKAVEVPNFTGKSKSEIQKQCDSLNINCSFTTSYSTSVKEGNAISQSIKAGMQIAEGDNIQIVIATKTKNTSTNKNNSSNSGNNNSNSSSNSSSSGSSSSNTSCQITNTYTFYWAPGSTYEQTVAMLKNQNPYVKSWSFNRTDACSNGNKANGTICKASISDGGQYNNCSSVSVTIVG